MASWLTVFLLAIAAVVLAWPARRGRARRRLVIGGAAEHAVRLPGSARSTTRPGRPTPSAPVPRVLRAARLAATVGDPRRFAAVWSYATAAPRLAILVVAGSAAGVGAVLGGPVAAVAVGAYGGLAARTALRRRSTRAALSERVRQLDALGALAADLRAGRPVATAASALSHPERSARVPAAGPEPAAQRLAALTRAAFHLAERTGAPLADLLERVEADARAMDRALAAAAAQAAGARATAWLLAGLPLGGIALGYAIGVDPLAVLLRTPIGAGCAVTAIALQFAGLAWADRLSGNVSRAS